MPEAQAASKAKHLHDRIKKRGGRYLRDENGNFSIVVEGRRIPISFDKANIALAELLIAECKLSTISQVAQMVIQRLMVLAEPEAERMNYRRFSYATDDRIYIPLTGDRVLRISKNGTETVENGTDNLWLEHPSGEPFGYKDADRQAALRTFERLLVETQACVKPALRWLVGVQLGLFPYIRDLCPGRFVTQIQGPSQDGGKTTGAQRFTLVHGLGAVKGDCSVPFLQNEGDVGLLVLDNREQANFDQKLTDFCLFLATGAQYGRSRVDGTPRPTHGGRPVAVLTTIEGVPKRELQNRIVAVDYRVAGEKLRREPIEAEIRRERHSILSALVAVFQHFLRIRGQLPVPNAIPNFRENFEADADLLRAFAAVSGKEPEWAERIIVGWVAGIGGREVEETELEHPICRVVDERLNRVPKPYSHNGRTGKLYIMTAGELLSEIQNLGTRIQSLPSTPRGLSARIRSTQFCAFDILDEDSATDVPELKRKSAARPIGLFFPDPDCIADRQD